eukprot:TRINITY_DN91100_c0_g1_i1.p1 TRINITY_DN91100_c0_g1~~TRINITY_DN91100_c0_g1_i1.p1  ORF type:complete len:236 (+),score=24.18 TRINITY_DN91100_c0_g1_i1:84-710(+)
MYVGCDGKGVRLNRMNVRSPYNCLPILLCSPKKEANMRQKHALVVPKKEKRRIQENHYQKEKIEEIFTLRDNSKYLEKKMEKMLQRTCKQKILNLTADAIYLKEDHNNQSEDYESYQSKSMLKANNTTTFTKFPAIHKETMVKSRNKKTMLNNTQKYLTTPCTSLISELKLKKGAKEQLREIIVKPTITHKTIGVQAKHKARNTQTPS